MARKRNDRTGKSVKLREDILRDMLSSCILNMDHSGELDDEERLCLEWELAVVQAWSDEQKAGGRARPARKALEDRIQILDNNIGFLEMILKDRNVEREEKERLGEELDEIVRWKAELKGMLHVKKKDNKKKEKKKKRPKKKADD